MLPVHPRRRFELNPFATSKDLSPKNPATLYDIACRALARGAHKLPIITQRDELLATLTDDMRLDLYMALKKEKVISILQFHMCHPSTFLPLLNIGQRRVDVHGLFQAVVEKIGQEFINRSLFNDIVSTEVSKLNLNAYTKKMRAYMNFVTFLMDAGWYEESEKLSKWILGEIRSRTQKLNDKSTLPELNRIETDSMVMLLHSLSSFCKFEEADVLYRQMVAKTMAESEEVGTQKNIIDNKRARVSKSPSYLSTFYSEFSSYCFHKSQYQFSYTWSLEAVRLLDRSDLSPETIIDILRQASQSCVVRRQFPKAGVLIQEAVLLAKEVYGENHPKYADCLTDYGFYLLNVDNISQSLQAYSGALKIRTACFGHTRNLKSAFAFEDLAYATYVKEYNTGKFRHALSYAEHALSIMEKVLPNKNHLLLASSKRVLALILEEIAIDTSDTNKSRAMLIKSEGLHMSALNTALKTFGMMNVQTAKHFGNLGRLYQSMQRFKEAEEMHLKAINIKEILLGKDDYEVALSIGHLASLYNYDMKEYAKAERLYLRSIEIGTKLFGESYSGLEYDYRGLIQVYAETRDVNKHNEYSSKLSRWKVLRDEIEHDNSGASYSSSKILAGKMRRNLDAIVSDVLKNEEEINVTKMSQMSQN